MKVIILCGGIGTRLKEETEYKPKPMVMVGNKPMIWHIMKIYSYFGFNDFILALGYKADYIKQFFLNQKALTSDFTLYTQSHRTKYYLDHRHEIDDFKITFVDTGIETLTSGRILKCQEHIPSEDKTFMVAYGDCLADVNVAEVLKFHRNQKTLGTTIGAHPHSKYGRIRIDKNNRVSEFIEKPVLSDWVNGGFMIFEKEALNLFKEDEMDYDSLKRLAKARQLSIYKHDGFWFAIDTYKEWEDLNYLWNSGNRPWYVWEQKKS